MHILTHEDSDSMLKNYISTNWKKKIPTQRKESERKVSPLAKKLFAIDIGLEGEY